MPQGKKNPSSTSTFLSCVNVSSYQKALQKRNIFCWEHLTSVNYAGFEAGITRITHFSPIFFGFQIRFWFSSSENFDFQLPDFTRSRPSTSQVVEECVSDESLVFCRLGDETLSKETA